MVAQLFHIKDALLPNKANLLWEWRFPLIIGQCTDELLPHNLVSVPVCAVLTWISSRPKTSSRPQKLCLVSEIFRVLLIATWSIWVSEVPQGDLHVSLWDFFCGKSVPSMHRSLRTSRYTKWSLLYNGPPQMLPNSFRLSPHSHFISGSLTLVTKAFLHFFL